MRVGLTSIKSQLTVIILKVFRRNNTVSDSVVEENIKMPVRKVKGGYRWGKSGKVYKTKKAAERQGRAIYASGYGKKKKKRSKKRNR